MEPPDIILLYLIYLMFIYNNGTSNLTRNIICFSKTFQKTFEKQGQNSFTYVDAIILSFILNIGSFQG